MQRKSNAPPGIWTFPANAFHPGPGIGWRLHMSKIGAAIQPRLPSRTPKSNPKAR